MPCPDGYRLVESRHDGGFYVRKRDRMTVIISKGTELDGREWLHLSCAFGHRVPTWSEFREMKEDFLGDRYAAVILPPESAYVNINPFVLHCFALADPDGEWPLPEFTRGGNTL